MSIHINSFDAFVKTLIILYRICGISLLLHIHINLFHAFVKMLIILCHTCGMFLPFTIPTKLMYILSCGNDSLESKTGATRKKESKREKTVIMSARPLRPEIAQEHTILIQGQPEDVYLFMVRRRSYLLSFTISEG